LSLKNVFLGIFGHFLAIFCPEKIFHAHLFGQMPCLVLFECNPQETNFRLTIWFIFIFRFFDLVKREVFFGFFQSF